MLAGNDDYGGNDDNDDHDDHDDDQGSPVTRGNAYRAYVAVFLVTLGPFAFFNLSKTKYLQVLLLLASRRKFIPI